MKVKKVSQTILYYPYINIDDGTWLRNALLYWDEVSSIVPYDNYEGLSAELSYLQSCGVYHPVYPRYLFSSDFANDFCDTIVKRVSAYERMASGSLRTNNRNVRIHKNKKYAPALHELIHYSKLPQNLLQLFEDKIFVNNYNTGGWMEMDSKIAQIYMRTLAEYSIKCSDKDIVLGTDTATHSRDIYNRSKYEANLQTQCCIINIQKCLPQPSLDVSFEDILDFKEKRKDELFLFRSKLRELETNIYKADCPELIKHYENQFIESWQNCSNDFYRVLKEERISFSLKSLINIVAIPFVNKLLSQRTGLELSTVLQTGSPLINLGIDFFNYKDKISPAKSDGGFSYIIKANKDGIIHM